MSKTSLLHILMVVASVSCSFTNLASANAAAVGFDGYMLALKWPKGVCATTKCQESVIPSKYSFTVHGLWPTSFDPRFGLGPMECAKVTQFSSKKLSATVQEALELWWPSMSIPNEQCWKHEYEKHGTCWLPESAELSQVPILLQQYIGAAVSNKNSKLKLQELYFLTAFTLTNQLRLEASLTASGFGPRAQPYDRQDFLAALKKITKTKKLTIICEPKSNILSEIRLCFDKNYQPADCAKDNIAFCSGTDLVFAA